MLEGIQPNLSTIKKYLDKSLMIVTALTPVIGYQKASEIAKLAYKEGTSLRQAAIKLDYINVDDFDDIINLEAMLKPKEE